mmetsp:Transcript_57529/g.186910  ORF Transcript_57529/g.186910 Transcript_57529/m.186910 type:complete len:147 (-) Transcript_57529:8-448(-)
MDATPAVAAAAAAAAAAARRRRGAAARRPAPGVHLTRSSASVTGRYGMPRAWTRRCCSQGLYKNVPATSGTAASADPCLGDGSIQGVPTEYVKLSDVAGVALQDDNLTIRLPYFHCLLRFSEVPVAERWAECLLDAVNRCTGGAAS